MPIARLTIVFLSLTVLLLAGAQSGMAARKAHRPHGLDRRAHYKGTTSQGMEITFDLSSDAKRVAKLQIRYKISCDDQTSASTYTNLFNAPIKSRGFSTHGSYTGDSDGSINKFQAKGSLTRTSAHGTFSLTATGKTAAGADLHCMSGTLTWTARKA